MNEMQSAVLAADLLPGMVISLESGHDSFITEPHLVLATRRVTQRRLFQRWMNEDDVIELLVISESTPKAHVVRADLRFRYQLGNVVQFMLNYAGPAIPADVWVEPRR